MVKQLCIDFDNKHFPPRQIVSFVKNRFNLGGTVAGSHIGKRTFHIKTAIQVLYNS